MKRADIITPESLWQRPVAEPYSIVDCGGETHTIVECTDGHFRRIVGNKICNSIIYCDYYNEWRSVKCDEDGKVIMIFIVSG